MNELERIPAEEVTRFLLALGDAQAAARQGRFWFACQILWEGLRYVQHSGPRGPWTAQLEAHWKHAFEEMCKRNPRPFRPDYAELELRSPEAKPLREARMLRME